MQNKTNRRRLLQSSALLASGGLLAANARIADAAEVDRSNLKITAVKSYLLRTKLKKPFGVSISVPFDTTREALLVKIETNQGLVGWGETSPINGARGTIDKHIGPRLIGKNPMHRRRLWRSMWGPNFGNALAVGALDIALDDIRGKALNMPVAELYGGRLRDRVPVYASAMNYVKGEKPEIYFPRQAESLAKKGYKALKMRIGRYSVNREAPIAASIRKAVGKDVLLMADGNAAYTMRSALRMGDALHKLDFEAFEEPMPQSPKYAGYEELRKKLPLSLAGGEALDSRATAKELLDRRCFDIIQPDTTLCGGIGEALFIAEMAALSGIRCYPHCWGAAIVIAATIHLISILPDPHWGFATDTPLLELDHSENPWRRGIVSKPFDILPDGTIKVPEGPGLGIEVNEKIVRQYAV